MLSARDIEIFRLLGRYRYLRSTFICAFFPEADQTGLVKRLGALFHEGYLDRPEQQYQYANALHLPAVYELNERSETVLRECGQGELPVVMQRGRRAVYRHFSHALMGADILASIELGVRQSEGLRFISWREIIDRAPCRDLANPFQMRVALSPAGGQGDHIGVIPDGLFGLEYREGSKRSYRFFALEADRNTMPARRSTLRQSSYLRKLMAYREVLARGVHKSHFGIPNLLILNVTVNDTHRRNIMEVLTEQCGGKGSPVFLFKTIGALGDFKKAPEPSGAMLVDPWERAGNPPFNIGEP